MCNISKPGEMRSLYLFLIYIASFLFLLPRLDGFDYFYGKYLWAEDGVIFLNDSQEIGYKSLFKPYAGYLHFYPRLVALVATGLDLLYRPVVLLVGWLLAYGVLIYAIARAAIAMNFSLLSIITLIGLVSLQPNNGEVFFNITNSQWMLGAALSVYAITTDGGSLARKAGVCLMLVGMGLTGPFCIVLAPVLMVKAIARRDWRYNSHVYIPVILSAIIQSTVLLNSNRVSQGLVDDSLLDWVMASMLMLSFGSGKALVLLAVFCFWSLVFYSLIKRLRHDRGYASILTPFLLFITAVLFIIAGLISSKQNPLAIVAIGAGGNRYSWVPYTLIYISVMMITLESRIINLFIILLSSIVCAKNFNKVSSPSLQFGSYANFSRFREVNIPINPQWPTYPGWHINGVPTGLLDRLAGNEIGIDSESMEVIGARYKFKDGAVLIDSTSVDSQVVLRDKVQCLGALDIGVEIRLTRDSEGWLQSFWSEDGSFAEKNSIRRWYPSGAVVAQFAFPSSEHGVHFRFDPMEVVGYGSIENIDIYCLH